MINFYAGIQKYRQDDESQTQFAERLGIGITTVDGWRLGRWPRIQQLVSVAGVLGKTPGELVDEAIAASQVTAEKGGGASASAGVEVNA